MNPQALTDLPDLAVESLGGWAMWANDEFFAEKENLLKPHPAEWREHEYTPRGKWMDGWETRRRREPGHDVCVVRLGLPGAIRAAVVDTAFFRGNFPAECMLEAARIDTHYDLRAIHDSATHWITLVPRSPLQGDRKNFFAIETGHNFFTHVRLSIFPDGGVARLRIHGEPRGYWWRREELYGPIDLAALENGARSVACSDMFFGSRQNLIAPGKPLTMGGGWETRRRRGPGHDWNLIALAAGGGRVLRAEVDTMHFKGNAPGRCSLEACIAKDDEAAQAPSANWRSLLPETPLQPNTRHLFDSELRVIGSVTHVRLNVFPDGGVARLRLWGEPDAGSPFAAALGELNALPEERARALLRACCASQKWVERLLQSRPFDDEAALYRIADRTWWRLAAEDWLQAFAAHPRIGDRTPDAVASQEQSGTRDVSEKILERLAAGNRAYSEQFGFTYIVCAAGKTASEMLETLEQRLAGTTGGELRTAAEEQAKILQLRLRKLLSGELEVK